MASISGLDQASCPDVGDAPFQPKDISYPKVSFVKCANNS